MIFRAICSLVAIALVFAQSTRFPPPSPCPDVFAYEPLGTGEKAEIGKWYGVVNLTADTTLYALWLNIILDSKADILGNWVGEVTTEDNYNFKIENTKMKITADAPVSVRFFVQYNAKDNVPRLRSILFNGREICNLDSAQSAVENPVSISNNFNIYNGVPVRDDKVTTTVRSTTTTKSKNQYGQKTTSKPSYWTQAKEGAVQSTTEKNQIKTETTTKNDNKGQVTSNIWSWVQTKDENTPQAKPVNNQQTKNKDQTQSTSGNTQSKADNGQWSQTKSSNTQQTTQNTRQQPTAQVWPQTQATVYQQTKSEKLQFTTERNTQVTSKGTSNTKSQGWSIGNVQNNQQAITENKQQSRPTNTQGTEDIRYQVSNQYYSQANGDTNQQNKAKNGQENRFGNDNRQSSGNPLNTQRPISQAVDYYSESSTKDDDYDESAVSALLPVIYLPNQRLEPECGKVTFKQASSPYGETTLEGQWPWQAAIYQQQKTVDFKYICSGTLVSYRHVITAAHCVTRKKSRRKVNQNTLTIHLGKYNLRTSVSGVQIKFVNKIIMHPEYNATTYSRNLAILELREAASITDWVRPACLWPENEIGRRNIVGKKGTVGGWGIELTGAPRAELTLLEMPVIDQETCISFLIGLHRNFPSDYTYCAGFNEGTSVCDSDSGGGMMFKKGSTWYLRGIAALSVARPNENRCFSNHYVIFTDIAKLLPWIEEIID